MSFFFSFSFARPFFTGLSVFCLDGVPVPIKNYFFLCHIPLGPINASPFGCWSQVIWGPVLLVAVTKAMAQTSVQAPSRDILAIWYYCWSGLVGQALRGVCRLLRSLERTTASL